jgi:nicotinamide riboside transporter PnuC
MNPIFHSIVWLLREHGEFVSDLFVYVAMPLISWHFGRRSGRRKTKTSHTFVLVIRPPVIRWNFETPDNASGPFGDQ